MNLIVHNLRILSPFVVKLLTSKVDSFLFLLNLYVYLRHILLHNINHVGSLIHMTTSRSLAPRKLNLNLHNIIFGLRLSVVTFSLMVPLLRIPVITLDDSVITLSRKKEPSEPYLYFSCHSTYPF